MHFDLGQREKDLCKQIKELFDQTPKPDFSKLEKGDSWEVRDVILAGLEKLARTDYLTLALDEGRDHIMLKAAQETLANICPALFLSVEMSARIFGRVLSVYANLDQKAEILTPLTQGRLIGAVALSEMGMDMDDPLGPIGVSVGDGFRVSGSTDYVVNAPIADWIAISGRLPDADEQTMVFFLIHKDSKGLRVENRLATLGYNGTPTSPIVFEDCHVSPNCVVGPFGAKETLMAVHMWEDQVLTSAGLGLMQRAFDTALHHAKGHKSGGKPLIAHQAVGFRLAEMLTLMQTAELLTYRAAWAAESQDREAVILAHCAKVFCSESAEQIASQALQILGGQGYIRPNPAEEGYRDAKFLQIAGTSSEISRTRIGDGVLLRRS